ncbi:MAG: hypothetical protein DI589_21260 [Shinella sp.]|nr:MAG: hypothetical protein DI589_21260 [Shinella sp.]
MVRRVAKRYWNELDLVCSTGVGLEALAPQVCRLLREIVGADAGALFWVDETGLPAGFFHEDTNAQARDLFVNAFEALFTGDMELNVATLVRFKGANCGHLLAPPDHYWRSNTYNLLVRASGHRHTLDLRVDHEGRPRAIIMLFRRRTDAFTQEHQVLLQMALPCLRKAFIKPPGADRWSETAPPAYIITDRNGETLKFATEAAHLLLQQGNQVAQGVPASGPLIVPPLFVRALCQRLVDEARPSQLLPSAHGRLRVSAEYLSGPQTGEAAVLVTLVSEVPDRLALVTQVLDLDLSPRQKSILLAAVSGVSRAQATQATGTSPEAMKKHLMAIFTVTGVHSWQDLQQRFTAKTGHDGLSA